MCLQVCECTFYIYIYVKLCVCLFCDASNERNVALNTKMERKKLSVCLKSMSKRTYEESVICLKISRCEIMWMKLGMVI